MSEQGGPTLEQSTVPANTAVEHVTEAGESAEGTVVENVEQDESLTLPELVERVQVASNNIGILLAKHPEAKLGETNIEFGAEPMTVDGLLEASKGMTANPGEGRALESILPLLEGTYDSLQERISEEEYALVLDLILEDPEEGDVFTHPGTEERLVVWGIQKKKHGDESETWVQYSVETKPEVPKEPGRNLRLLPVENFAVVGREYEASVETYVRHYERTNERFRSAAGVLYDLITGKPEDSRRVRELLEINFQDESELKQIEAVLDGMYAEYNALDKNARQGVTPELYLGKTRLLERAEQLISELPRPVAESDPYLYAIYQKYHQGDDKHAAVDGTARGTNDRDGLKRRAKRQRRRPEASPNEKAIGEAQPTVDEPKYVRRTDQSAQEASSVASPDVTVPPKTDAPRRRGRQTEALDLEAQGARELTDREVWRGFQKYHRARYSAEQWWYDRRNTLQDRIRQIRLQQTDLTRMAALIDKLGKRSAWERAMLRLGPEVLTIALRTSGDEVADILMAIRREKSKVLHKPVHGGKDGEELEILQDVFFRYLAVLQVGERVIASKLEPRRKSKPRAKGTGTGLGDDRPTPGTDVIVVDLELPEAEQVAREYALANVAATGLGESWRGKSERVQRVVIESLQRLEGQKDHDVKEIVAALDSEGVPADQHTEIITEGLSGPFNAAVEQILKSADLPTTSAAIESIREQLLAMSQPPTIPYDDRSSKE